MKINKTSTNGDRCQGSSGWRRDQDRMFQEDLPGDVANSVQFSSVDQSFPTLCDPMDCSTPGLPVHHKLLEFTQTCVHWVSDAIQPSHPLSSPSPPASNFSQHQDLFFFFFFSFFFKFYFIFKLYIIVLVLQNIKMNLPQVYMCSPSWTLLRPPSPYHPSGSTHFFLKRENKTWECKIVISPWCIMKLRRHQRGSRLQQIR